MKKKLLAVLLCVAMVATMAVGCGGGKDSGESKDEGKKSDLEHWCILLHMQILYCFCTYSS